MNFFQPRFINWSYLKRGIVHRIHMNTNKKITILVNKASKPNTAATLGDSVFSSKKEYRTRQKINRPSLHYS